MGASRAAIGLAFVVALAGASVARAQVVERLVNGDFDTDLDGWNVVALGSSSASWDALDAVDSPSSGSIRTEMVYEGQGNNVNASQCIDVAPGRPYSFGAWIRRQAGSGLGEGFVRVSWYDGTDCGGSFLSSSDAAAFGLHDTWVLAQLTDVLAPDTARSANFRLINLSQDETTPHVVYFDGAFFVPEPGAASGGAAALAALALLRRRRASSPPDSLGSC
ncbi:MAG TPA: hypothetical protein VIL20_05760 [Sandaracinaceae bacterium]|jgi:hypothetical protein